MGAPRPPSWVMPLGGVGLCHSWGAARAAGAGSLGAAWLSFLGRHRSPLPASPRRGSLGQENAPPACSSSLSPPGAQPGPEHKHCTGQRWPVSPGSVNARLRSRQLTGAGLGAEGGCTSPVPAGSRTGGQWPRRALPGMARPLGVPRSLGWRAGGESRALGVPGSHKALWEPVQKSLLTQIPADFQVLLFAAESEASRSRSTRDAFAPGASCQPEPGRADRA